MYDPGLPTADDVAAWLFRASNLSLDPSTADFSLRRVVPISILVEGDSDRVSEVAEQLRNDLKGVMEEAGYPAVGEWGPFTGSFFTTIFGKGNRRETGPELQQNIRRLVDRCRKLVLGLSPEERAGIHFVIVVGIIVVSIVGAGAVAAALPVTIPVTVIECVLHVAATEVVEAIHHALMVKK